MSDLSQCTIHLVGHAHIDLGYRWRWNETVHRIARDTFRGVLRLMEHAPELIFVQSQLALYEAMEQHYPDIFAAIKQRIAEGRWIVVDGWCEYDHMMTSGESMIRQHLLGSRYAREHLGCTVTMAWAPDAFSGHTHTLPTILKGCGIGYLLFGRGMPDTMPFFWWQGPDGSQVLSYTPVNTYSAVVGPDLLRQMAEWQETYGSNDMLVLYGRGDHGGGPRTDDIEALAHLRAADDGPHLLHTDPQVFFRDILQAHYNPPIYRGELGGGSTGSYTSQARSKQRSREIERLLLTAERFATIATCFQRKPVFPRLDFNQAWKTILRHQFHDELPGTSRSPVYEDIQADYDRVSAQMNGILATALAEIGNRVDTRGEGAPILVFNPLAWERSEPTRVMLRFMDRPDTIVVCDQTGGSLPTQVLSLEQRGHAWFADVLFTAEAMPPLGYKLFRAVTAGSETARGGVEITDMQLENQFLRVEADPTTGHLTKIYSKFAGRNLAAGPANVLQLIAEQPGAHSAWTIALTDQIDSLSQPESVQVVERGPVRAIIRASYRWRESFFMVDTIVYDALPWFEIRLQADWQERECCLKAAFPLAVAAGEATFDVPYGHIVRPADGTEALAQNWLDLSNIGFGLSLLNKARYGCDVKDNVLRLTLLRGIPDLDPRADQGEHDVSFAVYPHRGSWVSAQTPRRAMDFSYPLIARQEARHSGMMEPWMVPAAYQALPATFSFVRVEPPSVMLTALKVEEDEWGEWSPFIIRLFESTGFAADVLLTFPAPLRFCEETNHLEEPIASNAVTFKGDTVRVQMKPYEIKTLRLALVQQSLGLPEASQEEEANMGIRGAGR